jgi:hypothetical protein
MTFLSKVKSQYAIVSSSTIKTTEPIKIEYECKDEMFLVTVDGIDYAVIDHVSSPEQVDLKKVGKWVEETYYDGDYKSSAYTPARLPLKEFRK